MVHFHPDSFEWEDFMNEKNKWAINYVNANIWRSGHVVANLPAPHNSLRSFAGTSHTRSHHTFS
jgi:hypothetical protein